MVGRTTLIIAHRLSTLHAVDDIVVFDHGEVAEFGARAELIGDDESQFARLVALSLDAADDDVTADPATDVPTVADAAVADALVAGS